jgi:hypothetical protein
VAVVLVEYFPVVVVVVVVLAQVLVVVSMDFDQTWHISIIVANPAKINKRLILAKLA